MTNTTNTSTDKITRDKRGFPIVTCSRCGGGGEYLYNCVDGTMCYGCRGTGWKLAPAAVKDFKAYKAIYDAQVKVLVGNVQPGWKVRPQPEDEWMEVAAIDISEVACAWEVHGENRKAIAFRCVVTFTDGSTVNSTTNQLWRGQPTVSPKEYAERAMAKHKKQLARRR